MQWFCMHSSPISRFCREMCIKTGSATKPSLRSVRIRLLVLMVSLLCLYLNRSCVRNLLCW